MEQYETSLHALQAIFPGFSQAVYFMACTLAHCKVLGGGYRGDMGIFNIFWSVDWKSVGPRLSIPSRGGNMLLIVGSGGISLIFSLCVDMSRSNERTDSAFTSAILSGVISVENCSMKSSIVAGKLKGLWKEWSGIPGYMYIAPACNHEVQ